MRVLLVEDDQRIGQFVVKGLKQEGHIVDWSQDGEEGLGLLAAQPYDVGIVDIMLPKRDGLSLVREGRRRGVDTPLLILSAKSAVDDRVSGLQAGADDYLTKPFSFVELSARLSALVRRSTKQAASDLLRYDELALDLRARRATRGETTLELQPKELALLEYFLRNQGRVLSKTMILEAVWDYAFDPQTNVVDVLVHRLRKKVDQGFAYPLIQTVRGMGYVLRRE